MDAMRREPDTGPNEAEQQQGNRAQRRDSLLLMAAVTLAGDPTSRDVRVRNISEGGLMAELAIHLPSWSGSAPEEGEGCGQRKLNTGPRDVEHSHFPRLLPCLLGKKRSINEKLLRRWEIKGNTHTNHA